MLMLRVGCAVLLLCGASAAWAESLEEGFAKPPAAAMPGVWWRWIDGTVTRIAYRHGKFLNASLDKASTDNERNALALRLADVPELPLAAVLALAGAGLAHAWDFRRRFRQADAGRQG
jgi:hypothetical protein